MASHDCRQEYSDTPPARRSSLLQVGVVVLAILVLIALLAPGVQRGRSFSRRAECQSNLKSILLMVFSYTNGYSPDTYWHVVAHMPPVSAEIGNVDYAPRTIGIHRSRPTTPADREISVTRNLYNHILVRYGLPRSFICPESGDYEAKEDAFAFEDFASIRNVSYGQQVPYGKFGRPGLMGDEMMPLLADKGPYGTAMESGNTPPGPPTVGVGADAVDWRPWNSPNHGGEGQNVGLADGSVSWCRVPVVGLRGDNIYTRWSQADGGLGTDTLPRVQGTPPTRNETPWSNTDTLIYP